MQITIKKKQQQQQQQKHFCSLPVPAVQVVGTAKRDVRRRKKTTRGWGRGKSEEASLLDPSLYITHKL